MSNSIKAKEILDSKRMPTIEVELTTENGKFLASVPSGVSTGDYEAVELRDEDGKGVLKAIKNIDTIIAEELEKAELSDQKNIDDILINLDGTKNKSRLGANATLAVSIAVCRAIAKPKNISLWEYISEISGNKPSMPKPSFNMIEGGKHSDSGLAFQEFMIVPQRDSFDDNLKIGIKIYQKLGEILKEKFGEGNIVLSTESAYSAPIKEIMQAFDLILESAESVGYKNEIKFAIDAAASSFYKDLSKKYPILSIEDPFFEEDFEGFSELNKEIKGAILILGDDLLATNIERIKTAQEKDSCSAIIMKPNQIGTVSEAISAGNLAKSFGWKVMVSNRGGETEDDFIADLAVGIGAEFMKSGAPFAKERMVKYNRLLQIEKEFLINN